MHKFHWNVEENDFSTLRFDIIFKPQHCLNNFLVHEKAKNSLNCWGWIFNISLSVLKVDVGKINYKRKRWVKWNVNYPIDTLFHEMKCICIRIRAKYSLPFYWQIFFCWFQNPVEKHLEKSKSKLPHYILRATL